MKRWHGLLAIFVVIAGVICFLASRPPSALRIGFERIETNMSMAEVEGFIGPCEPTSPSHDFPYWVDGDALYDKPESSFALSWTDDADTVWIVFSDDWKVVKKAFYSGRRGQHDRRWPWHRQIKTLLGVP
jgi:hypothetical protein